MDNTPNSLELVEFNETQQEPLGGDEGGRVVASTVPDPSVRLQALLEASRGIQLPKVEGSTIKLSKFTKKQLSRRNKVRPGTVRKGKHLRVVKKRPRRHYKTALKVRREWQRAYHRSARRKFWELRKKKGAEQWLITEEEWADIWDLLGTHSFEVRRYEEDKPFTKYNLYIFTLKGVKLYEGYEEQLRDLGYLT
jgi:hypothetical protein